MKQTFTIDGKEPQMNVTKKPTVEMPHGIYRVVDEAGIYWGTFKVVTNWCNEKFVMEWMY